MSLSFVPEIKDINVINTTLFKHTQLLCNISVPTIYHFSYNKYKNFGVKIENCISLKKYHLAVLMLATKFVQVLLQYIHL